MLCRCTLTVPSEIDKRVAIDDARRIEDFLRQAARGTTAVLGADGIVDDLGDGRPDQFVGVGVNRRRLQCRTARKAL